MTGAMYAAVSGLRTHMTAMNVIGENISNVNTYAYKNTRYTFNEQLYTNYKNGSNGNNQMGGNNPAQIGYGVSIGTIDLDMSTKSYVPTGIATDCMIDGDGMFIVGDKSHADGILDQETLQAMTLSRLGNFSFDAEGWLVDGNGEVVYGYLCTGTNDNDEFVYSPTLTAIRLPYCTNTLDNNNTIQTNVYYPKVGDGEEIKTNENLPVGGDITVPAGSIVDGPTSLDNYAVDANGNYPEIERVSLDSIQIDKTGRISGITQDDQLVVVGYVALAKVDNPNGLTHTDGRYFQALDGAGNVHLTSIGGTLAYDPNTVDENTVINTQTGCTSEIAVLNSGDTGLVTNGLESSGTDLATEISNMVIIQRGYQANTRIVTVTDSMLEELVNMKR